MSTATIIVPCYNESERMDVDAYCRFAAADPNIHFLVVNDGSSDDTSSLLERLRTNNPASFDVLNLPQNGGKAEAVRQGVLHASRTQADYIGYWDADLATPLEAIPEFIAVLDRRREILMTLGVRIPLSGHTIQRRFSRRLLGRTFSRLSSFLLGMSLSDTQCGAKLFRATPEILSLFSRHFRARWIFDVELLARIAAERRNSSLSLAEIIYEIPLERWQDVAGSKLKKTDFIKALLDLGAIWWHELRPGASLPQPHSVAE